MLIALSSVKFLQVVCVIKVSSRYAAIGTHVWGNLTLSCLQLNIVQLQAVYLNHMRNNYSTESKVCTTIATVVIDCYCTMNSRNNSVFISWPIEHLASQIPPAVPPYVN